MPGTFCDAIATTKSGMPMLMRCRDRKNGHREDGLRERDVKAAEVEQPERARDRDADERASSRIA